MKLNNTKITHKEVLKLLEMYFEFGYKVKFMPYVNSPNTLKIKLKKGDDILNTIDYILEDCGKFKNSVDRLCA